MESKFFKGYIDGSETHCRLKPEDSACIYIGLYDEKDRTDGELTLTWKRSESWERGPSIEIHGDAFKLFHRCSDIFTQLGVSGEFGPKDLTKERVVRFLDELGYKRVE